MQLLQFLRLLYALFQLFHPLLARKLLVSTGSPPQKINMTFSGYPYGINLEESCDAYLPKLEEAMKSLKEISKAGYQAAKNTSNWYYDAFFRPEDKTKVQQVMKNLWRTLSYKGTQVLVYCGDHPQCATQIGAAGFQATENWWDDVVVLCPFALRGELWNVSASNNFCNAPGGFTWAEYLMHEMMHHKGIAQVNGARVSDIGYSFNVSRLLRLGLVKHQETDKILAPTMNAQNYVLMARTARHIEVSTNAKLCPKNFKSGEGAVIDRTELRKLQMLNEDFDCPQIQPLNDSTSIGQSQGIPVRSGVAVNNAKAGYNPANISESFPCNVYPPRDSITINLPLSDTDIVQGNTSQTDP